MDKEQWIMVPLMDSIATVGDLIKDGERNGLQGTETFSTWGNSTVGEFKDGLPNGQGTETFSNGGKYVGEFKDGLLKWSRNRNFLD